MHSHSMGTLKHRLGRYTNANRQTYAAPKYKNFNKTPIPVFANDGITGRFTEVDLPGLKS